MHDQASSQTSSVHACDCVFTKTQKGSLLLVASCYQDLGVRMLLAVMPFVTSSDALAPSSDALVADRCRRQ